MSRAPQRAPNDPAPWTLREAEETYGIPSWGGEHFSVNEKGHLAVGPGDSRVDLKELVDDLVKRGIELPLLIRFSGLLEDRIRLLHEAFGNAIDEYGYRGSYRGVYPIKVNQSRQVVEGVTRFGRPFHYGLEAGSKPELLAVMAMLDDPEALVVCNGYKDRQYIEMALLASRLRRRVVLVVEKPSELELIRRVAEELEIRPSLGIRMKLSARGSGRWQESGGEHAKFGLNASEIVAAMERLREWRMLDSVRLLHFHLGSQITAIRSIKDALREASRMLTEMVRMGCDGLEYLDVGGGLGVDYDGSQTDFDYSVNYTVQEYANDVVSAVQEACDEAGVEHPTLVSESGRAVVAQHSVLVVNVIGVNGSAPPGTPREPAEDAPAVLHNLWHAYATVEEGSVRECFHDAVEAKDQLLSLFNLGHLTLTERAEGELLYWAGCRRMAEMTVDLSPLPKELEALEEVLSDTYFCNFSMFQSLPDMWAVGQLFPILPIHRLDQRPTRRGILADITCDSDGAIDRFIGPDTVGSSLPLHDPDGEPYHLAVLFTGAYQEILGDLHNLFGDTHVASVSFDGAGGYSVDEVLDGDTVAEVLEYVEFEPRELTHRLRSQVEQAVRSGHMSVDASRQLMQQYRQALSAYTYLG